MVRKLSLPDVYAIIAFCFGIFFIIVTPPFGTGDETAHFERSYEIASGQFLGAEGLPSGMQALIDDAFGKVKSETPVNLDDYARWSSIDLERDEITPWPSPIRAVLRLHSPLCYLHFAPVAAAGVALGLPPLWIFYLGRLVALGAGVLLVRAAIARAPAMFRAPMALVALLPTTVVYFAAYNIESLLIGLGFYYFALVASLAAGLACKLSREDIVKLAAVAFLLGQFKTGYLFLPAFALVLPASKFASFSARAMILSLIILPGAAASIFWAFIVKDAMLGDLVYSTLNGNHVEPAAQLAGVLADPLGYAGVVWRTLFASGASDIALRTFLGVGGWTNIPVPVAFYAVLSAALLVVWLSGENPPRALTTPVAVTIQLGIFGATALAILTLVYFQWNGVGDDVIAGFQGRYLIAATPLLLAAAPARLSLLAAPFRRNALAFGAPMLGLAAMSVAVVQRYW